MNLEGSNVIDDAPPPVAAGTSEFVARIHPPSTVGNAACPSVKSCQRYVVPSTGCPPRAITRDLNPGGSEIPLASNAPSAPYGLPSSVAAARSP